MELKRELGERPSTLVAAFNRTNMELKRYCLIDQPRHRQLLIAPIWN